MPIIASFESPRHKDLEFKTRLVYTVSSMPASDKEVSREERLEERIMLILCNRFTSYHAYRQDLRNSTLSCF